MTITGEWGALVRQIEALQMALEKTTEPEEIGQLSQQIMRLKARQAELREAGAAGSPGLPGSPRFAFARQKAIDARFAAWLDEELERALGDRELMAELFQKVECGEQEAGPPPANEDPGRPPGSRPGRPSGRGGASPRGTRR